MTLTTGYEFTTAMTNVFNAVITAVLLICIHRLNIPKLRKQLWTVTFGLFLVVCILGAAAHGIVLSTKSFMLVWYVLYAVLGLMIAVFAAAVLYETDGPASLRRTVPVLATAAILFIVINTVMRMAGLRSFLSFLLYSGSILLILIARILRAWKKKPQLRLLFAGILVMIAGSVLQSIKSIHVHLIFDFDYNSVYHLATLVFVSIIFIYIKKTERQDAEQETEAKDGTAFHK